MTEPIGQFTKFETNKVTVHAEGWGSGFLKAHWEKILADSSWELEQFLLDGIEGPRLGPSRTQWSEVQRAKKEDEKKAFWGVRYRLPGLGLRKMLRGCDCEEW